MRWARDRNKNYRVIGRLSVGAVNAPLGTVIDKSVGLKTDKAEIQDQTVFLRLSGGW